MGVKPFGKSDRRWVHRDFERWCFRIVTAVVITVLSSGRMDGVMEDEKGIECFGGVKWRIWFLMMPETDAMKLFFACISVAKRKGLFSCSMYSEGW